MPEKTSLKWIQFTEGGGDQGGLIENGGGGNACLLFFLKGVFVINERGYRLMAKNKRVWSLLILLLSVAEEPSVHTNSENSNILLGS